MNDNTCGHECCSPDLEDGCTVDKCVDHPHAPPIIDPSKPVPVDVAMNLARREYAAGVRDAEQRLRFWLDAQASCSDCGGRGWNGGSEADDNGNYYSTGERFPCHCLLTLRDALVGDRT